MPKLGEFSGRNTQPGLSQQLTVPQACMHACMRACCGLLGMRGCKQLRMPGLQTRKLQSGFREAAGQHEHTSAPVAAAAAPAGRPDHQNRQPNIVVHGRAPPAATVVIVVVPIVVVVVGAVVIAVVVAVVVAVAVAHAAAEVVLHVDVDERVGLEGLRHQPYGQNRQAPAPQPR